MSDSANIMPGLKWIHHTVLQVSVYIIKWTLYSSGTGGTREPVHFMKHWAVRKSGADLYRFISASVGTLYACPDNHEVCSSRKLE